VQDFGVAEYEILSVYSNFYFKVVREYFNVQLITICAVVKLNVPCKMCSCCIVNWLIPMFMQL